MVNRLKLGILGCSNPYVWNILSLADSLGYEVLLVSNQRVPSELELPSFTELSNLSADDRKLPFFTGVVRPSSKRVVIEEGLRFGLDFTSQLVSSKAHLGFESKLSDGVIVGPLSIVDAKTRIGEYTTISPLVCVGHHTSVGSYCHLANGVTVSGNVAIGDDVFVGAGAVIRDGISIGHGAIIGMGAVVVEDVPENSVVMGNPARTR
jgi:sugar O-acyltransferase (sialic acid O-acetyltransferase NeuD family)